MDILKTIERTYLMIHLPCIRIYTYTLEHLLLTRVRNILLKSPFLFLPFITSVHTLMMHSYDVHFCNTINKINDSDENGTHNFNASYT